jgi:hypothetical protein
MSVELYLGPMIPTMLLAGLLLGRWWVIALGGLGWAALLLLGGDIGVGDAPFAAALGAVNVGIGVGVRRSVRAVLRLASDRDPGSAAKTQR